MRYLVIIEQAQGNLSAYVPDLPGCVAVGDTREELLETMREAIEMHLESMRESGEPIPTPNSEPAWVDVSQPHTIAGAGA
jgi:predicted RNase H-like HicB family nuclease